MSPMTMCLLRLSKWWRYGPAMPLDRAIADEYRARVARGDWGCTALLELVHEIQAAHPELSQSAAVTRAMEIVRRARERADGLG
jgi:hypothetical protein